MRLYRVDESWALMDLRAIDIARIQLALITVGFPPLVIRPSDLPKVPRHALPYDGTRLAPYDAEDNPAGPRK